MRNSMDQVGKLGFYREAAGGDAKLSLVLALVRAAALLVSVALNELEIFLLSAPFSAGVFLLLPTHS